MGLDKKSMKKMFPHLTKELEEGENKIQIDSIRADESLAEETAAEAEDVLIADAANIVSDKFRHYNPTVVDFVRRCDTEEQAKEVISFLQKRGEITAEYAVELKVQLKRDGVRSFGPKKEEGHYFKESGLC